VPDDSTTLLRTRLLLALGILVIAGAVWGVSQVQRDTADRGYRESAAAERMLVAMLDQETGLRGFALTRSEEFLAPFRDGLRDYAAALAEVRRTSDDEGARSLIVRQARTATQWQGLAREEIDVLRRNPARPLDPALAIERKLVFDRFRRGNERFRVQLKDARTAELGRAGSISVAVILVLGLLFGGLGLLAINRSARRARERRRLARAYSRWRGCSSIRRPPEVGSARRCPGHGERRRPRRC